MPSHKLLNDNKGRISGWWQIVRDPQTTSHKDIADVFYEADLYGGTRWGDDGRPGQEWENPEPWESIQETVAALRIGTPEEITAKMVADSDVSHGPSWDAWDFAEDEVVWVGGAPAVHDISDDDEGRRDSEEGPNSEGCGPLQWAIS